MDFEATIKTAFKSLRGDIFKPVFAGLAHGDGSVNVESRTSSQDKRWTIMAALLGTNTAVMLFQGMEQEANPTQNRSSLDYHCCNASIPSDLFLIYLHVGKHRQGKPSYGQETNDCFEHLSNVRLCFLGWRSRCCGHNLSIFVGLLSLHPRPLL